VPRFVEILAGALRTGLLQADTQPRPPERSGRPIAP